MQAKHIDKQISSHSATRAKKYIGLFLVFALVITGLYAFMVAKDSKKNVFTVGNVKAEFWEINDINGDGEIDGLKEEGSLLPADEDSTTDEIYGPTEEEATYTTPLFPEETRKKAPYIKNSGRSSEWVFMEVVVPLIEAGTQASGRPEINVTAYVSQPENEETDTPESIWAIIKSSLNKTDSDNNAASDMIPMFELNDIGESWQLMDIRKSSDNCEHRIYAYNSLLDSGNYTTPVFGSVTLLDNSQITVAFMDKGRVVSKEILSSADESVVAPSLPDGYTWITEKGVDKAAGANIKIDDDCYVTRTTTDGTEILNKNYVVINAVGNTDSYIIEGDSSSLPVKLVPTNEASTAMIERENKIETYNTGLVFGPHSGLSTITPITEEYGDYTKDFDAYFVYGLETNMTAAKLTNLVKVQGDGYATVTLTQYNVEGTGTLIQVYDRKGTENTSDDELVEQFRIVIYGDVNGDSIVSSSDYDAEYKSISAEKPIRKIYYIKAGDLNSDIQITTTDYDRLYTVIIGRNIISQKNGLTSKKTTE